MESAEWTAEVPRERADARHDDDRHHDHEPARLLRQAAQPARQLRRARGVPRRGDRHRAGQGQGRRLGVLRRGARSRSATSSASSSRATSAAPVASPARSTSGLKAGRSKYVLMLDDDVECRDRGPGPRRHVRRPVPPAHHRRRAHVQPVPEDPAAQLRREGRAVPLLVGRRARVSSPAGTSARATSAPPAGCTRRIDVDYNGWFMCLIPTEVLAADRSLRSRSSSSGTTPSTACAPRRPGTRR